MVYGSERLGTVHPYVEPVLLTADPTIYTRKLRLKEYELKDHLGNVRVVISDLKRSTNACVGCAIVPGSLPFVADIKAYTNYYPFGMEQEDRSWSGEGYRYGYNGMEKDDELKGEGASYDYGARMYDPRLGRWWKTDDFFKMYPSISPYAFAGNSPIKVKDEDGNLLTDDQGNIIVALTGSVVKREVPLKVNAKGEGYVLHTEYEVAYVFGNDGSKVRSLILRESTMKNYSINKAKEANGDKSFSITSVSIEDYTKATGKCSEAVSDCHGFSFAEGKLWIDDGDVANIIDGDDLQYTNHTNGDIVLYAVPKQDNVTEMNGFPHRSIALVGGTEYLEIIHSAVRSTPDTELDPMCYLYDNDAGVSCTEYNQTVISAARGFEKKYPNIHALFLKKGKNAIIAIPVDIDSEVSNGMRFIDEDDIEDIPDLNEEEENNE